MTTKMQLCVDHIKTSLDVDPWAAEMVEQIFTEYDKRFDKVLEIIDEVVSDRFVYSDVDEDEFDRIDLIKIRILALKGGEQE